MILPSAPRRSDRLGRRHVRLFIDDRVNGGDRGRAGSSAVAALLPIVVAPLAAIGLWQLLVVIRPGYATLFMGDPYRPHFYRWALAALTVTILLTWYLALRRRIGPASLAIGALAWPTVLGVVTASLLPAMSYYGSLATAAAGGGALIALLLRERLPIWSVVALAA
jgi:hypothetical protein